MTLRFLSIVSPLFSVTRAAFVFDCSEPSFIFVGQFDIRLTTLVTASASDSVLFPHFALLGNFLLLFSYGSGFNDLCIWWHLFNPPEVISRSHMGQVARRLQEGGTWGSSAAISVSS